MLAEYYVYQYLRKDGSPYYIGKGKGGRVTRKRKYIVVPDDRSLIQYVAVKLFEHEAHLLETKLIALYGRKDLGTGILRNLTDGGEGTSGHKHSEESKQKMREAKQGKKRQPHSEETKIKMSLAQKGHRQKPHAPEVYERMAKAAMGRKHPPRSKETRMKISAAGIGRVLSTETKRKIGLAQRGKPKSEEQRRKQSDTIQAKRYVQ